MSICSFRPTNLLYQRPKFGTERRRACDHLKLGVAIAMSRGRSCPTLPLNVLFSSDDNDFLQSCFGPVMPVLEPGELVI